MERFKIIKIVKEKEYFSIRLYDKKRRCSFWIDCSLIDGYGKRTEYEKEKEIFIDWEFNQYIFDLYNSIDLKAKEYQENAENVDDITYFIDDKNDDIIKEVFA